MTTKFTLEIRLGNDLMQDKYDLAEALRSVADRLAPDGYDGVRPRLGEGARILDGNGERVGTWLIDEQKTGKEIAQQVLDAHAIQPNWVRNGIQMVGLLDEAVEIARKTYSTWL